DELAANHDGRQVVEGPHRLGADLAQGVEQAEEGSLEDVVGLLPAAQLGGAPEHAVGERFEAPGDAAEEFVARAVVAGLHAVQPVVELSRARRVPRGLTHGGPRARGSAGGPNAAAPRGDTRVSRTRPENVNLFRNACRVRAAASVLPWWKGVTGVDATRHNSTRKHAVNTQHNAGHPYPPARRGEK